MSQDQLFQHREIRRVPKPWGYELIFAKTGKYVGKILHINRNETLSLQYHEMKEETLYVVRGELKLTVEYDGDRRELTLREGQAFHIPPRLIHRMEAISDTDVLSQARACSPGIEMNFHGAQCLGGCLTVERFGIVKGVQQYGQMIGLAFNAPDRPGGINAQRYLLVLQ